MMRLSLHGFRLNVIGRVVVIAGTMLAEMWLLLHGGFPVTAAVVGGILVLEGVWLIRYVESTARDLTRFFASIAEGDVTTSYARRGLGSAFDALHDSFALVMEQFQAARGETEEHYQSLQTILQHVGVGLLTYQDDGTVGLINTAAKRLLGIHQLATVHALTEHNGELASTLLRLRSGEKALVRVDRGIETLSLVIHATEFRLHDRRYTLASLQNIGSELEEKEMEAWQNLIRVLTHEIMNSITPISSLASTVHGMVAGSHGPLDRETADDVRGALETIVRRSEGLLHFVDAYRDLTRIPRPEMSVFPVAGLLARIDRLLRPQLTAANVALEVNVEDPELAMAADQGLLEQVLINLVQNAMYALRGRKDARVRMSARMGDDGHVAIEVEDNGPGIPPDVQGKIFIPFFTTRKEGSGIGLSLARQILRLHRGTISVRSVPEERTVFLLRV